MSFFEVEFPTQISYKAIGGPGFNTTVNPAFSGQEARNKNWSLSRGQWTVSLLTPSPEKLQALGLTRQQYIDLLNGFFLVVSGKGDAFRLKDHKDYLALGMPLSPAIADGTNRVFQLQKVYTIGGRTYTRTITKPITAAVNDYAGNALANTVFPYIGGVKQTTNYSVDQTTGILTFAAGHAPTALAAMTADSQFHYPVRFDTDQLPIQTEESDFAGGEPIISVNSVGLIEVRPPNY